MGRTAFARRDAGNHLGAIGERLFGVEGAGGTGHPLGDDLGVLVHQNGHACPFTFCGRGTWSNASRFRLRTYLKRDGAALKCQASEGSIPLHASSSSLTASTET